MINLSRLLTIAAAFALVISCSQKNSQKHEISKSFTAKDTVIVETISADCIIKSGKSDSIRIHVSHNYRPADAYQPGITQEGNKLTAKEYFQGSASGNAVWTLQVPQNTVINISSVSGEIQIDSMKNGLNAETVSGYINVKNCDGPLVLETVSGGIKGNNLTGGFTVETISGAISFSDIKISSRSSWDNISGNSIISIKEKPEADIDIGSISGNSVLNFNGIPLTGSFEFNAQADKGEIISPVKFTAETEFEHEEKKFYRKSFQMETENPKIVISTISGKAELRKE